MLDFKCDETKNTFMTLIVVTDESRELLQSFEIISSSIIMGANNSTVKSRQNIYDTPPKATNQRLLLFDPRSPTGKIELF